MKKLLLSFVLGLCICTIARGENRLETVRNAETGQVKVLELADTVIDGKTKTDTLSVTTYLTESEANELADSRARAVRNGESSSVKSLLGMKDFGETFVSTIAIIFVFGTPIFICFIVFFFRYKNRKARYQLIEQALEKGQTLPAEMWSALDQTAGKKDGRTKGFSNIALGLGLFIFFWALTDEFGLACIGLLIMFMGFGQTAIFYAQRHDEAVFAARSEYGNAQRPVSPDEAVARQDPMPRQESAPDRDLPTVPKSSASSGEPTATNQPTAPIV